MHMDDLSLFLVRSLSRTTQFGVMRNFSCIVCRAVYRGEPGAIMARPTALRVRMNFCWMNLAQLKQSHESTHQDQSLFLCEGANEVSESAMETRCVMWTENMWAQVDRAVATAYTLPPPVMI